MSKLVPTTVKIPEDHLEKLAFLGRRLHKEEGERGSVGHQVRLAVAKHIKANAHLLRQD